MEGEKRPDRFLDVPRSDKGSLGLLSFGLKDITASSFLAIAVALGWGGCDKSPGESFIEGAVLRDGGDVDTDHYAEILKKYVLTTFELDKNGNLIFVVTYRSEVRPSKIAISGKVLGANGETIDDFLRF